MLLLGGGGVALGEVAGFVVAGAHQYRDVGVAAAGDGLG
jgi:hypothetical protein